MQRRCYTHTINLPMLQLFIQTSDLSGVIFRFDFCKELMENWLAGIHGNDNRESDDNNVVCAKRKKC